MHFCITKDIEHFLKGRTRYLNPKTEEFFNDLLNGRFSNSAEMNMFLLQVELLEKDLKEKGTGVKPNAQLSHLEFPGILYTKVVTNKLDLTSEPVFMTSDNLSPLLKEASQGTCLMIELRDRELPYSECFPLTDWLQMLKYEDLLSSKELIATLDALEDRRLFLLKVNVENEVVHTINWHRA